MKSGNYHFLNIFSAAAVGLRNTLGAHVRPGMPAPSLPFSLSHCAPSLPSPTACSLYALTHSHTHALTQHALSLSPPSPAHPLCGSAQFSDKCNSKHFYNVLLLVAIVQTAMLSTPPVHLRARLQPHEPPQDHVARWASTCCGS